MDVDVVTIDDTATATATLQAAQVSNIKILLQIDGLDDATDATNAADDASDGLRCVILKTN